MIENNTTQIDALHNRGTDRLLADIAAAAPSIDAEIDTLREAACKIVGFRAGVSASRTSRNNWRGEPVSEWQVYAWPTDMGWVNASGVTIDETLTAFAREFRKAAMKARIEKDAEAAMKALDAADVAEQMDRATTGTLTPTRDDGEATTGTLPLVKLGQGDYTREVRP
jgi:hypothetical protein